ncbi:hypothetical protein KVV02_007535 [Mortierella alpina]|uniref:GYF domain-containing protein n=1 Tax=Mortierella alpina TaxID=64518 RepID=A0A9P8A7S8_MORAP|nr:hypothetical protein KVV02_007535 [Mortierella alpina]
MASNTMNFGPEWMRRFPSKTSSSSSSTFLQDDWSQPAPGSTPGNTPAGNAGAAFSYSSVAANNVRSGLSSTVPSFETSPSDHLPSDTLNPFKYSKELMLSLFKPAGFPIEFERHEYATNEDALMPMSSQPFSDQEIKILSGSVNSEVARRVVQPGEGGQQERGQGQRTEGASGSDQSGRHDRHDRPDRRHHDTKFQGSGSRTRHLTSDDRSHSFKRSEQGSRDKDDGLWNSPGRSTVGSFDANGVFRVTSEHGEALEPSDQEEAALEPLQSQDKGSVHPDTTASDTSAFHNAQQTPSSGLLSNGVEHSDAGPDLETTRSRSLLNEGLDNGDKYAFSNGNIESNTVHDDAGFAPFGSSNSSAFNSTPAFNAAPAELSKWLYRDPSGSVQGPFQSVEMHEWYKGGFFSMDLLVKREQDVNFEPLGSLIRRLGNEEKPFLNTLDSNAGWAGDAFARSSAMGGLAGPQTPMAGSFASQQQRLLNQQLERQQYMQLLQRQIQMQHMLHQQQFMAAQQQFGNDPHALAALVAQQQAQQRQLQMRLQQLQHMGFMAANVSTPGGSAIPALNVTDAKVTEEEIKHHDNEIWSSQSEAVEHQVPAVEDEGADSENETDMKEQVQEEASVDDEQAEEVDETENQPNEQTPAALWDDHVPETSSWGEVTESSTWGATEQPRVIKAVPAPWAKPVGGEEASEKKALSLREIQEIEAKRAEEQRAAERDAQIASGASGVLDFGRGLGGTPWQTASAPKKTLRQIQEEEEAAALRKARAAQVAPSASVSASAPVATVSVGTSVGLAGIVAAGTGSGGKRYADTIGPKPTATTVSSGPWGSSSSLMAAKAAPVARAPSTPAATNGSVTSTLRAAPRVEDNHGWIEVSSQKSSSSTAGAVVESTPTRTTPLVQKKVASSDEPREATEDFLRWCRQALKGLQGVVLEDFIQMLLSFPLNPDPMTVEIIQDSIYANSQSLNGRQFADEFIKRRKADAYPNGMGNIANGANSNNNQQSLSAHDGSFKVVSKKGRKKGTA